MADRTQHQAVSKAEMDLWCRIIGRRRTEWSSLPRTELVAVIRPMWNKEQSTPVLEDPWERTEWLLTRHFNMAVDRTVPAKQRRSSWHCLNSLLQALDDTLKSLARNRENGCLTTEIHAPNPFTSGSASSNFVAVHSNNDDTVIAATTSIQPGTSRAPSIAQVPPQEAQESSVSALAQKQQPAQSTAPNRSPSLGKEPFVAVAQSSQTASLSLGSSRSSSTSKNKPVANGVAVTRQPLPTPQQTRAPQRPQPVQRHQQERPANIQPPAQTATAIPRATPEITASKPINKQTNGSMGSAFSSTTAKVAPAAAATDAANARNTKKAAPAKQTHKAPPPPPALPLPPVTISFGADTQRFACAIDRNGRSNLRATFSPRVIAKEEATRTTQRLDTWDPYWTTEHVVAMIETFPITHCENLKTGTTPRQATECTVKLPSQIAQKVRDWGKRTTTEQKLRNGDVRLLVRMLPVKLVPKKRPRADTHLWPKGTFMQLGGMPVVIQQRRQQSHDPKEWKSMSVPLDLTSHIAKPTKDNKLQLYFLDNEPYVMCVALCAYREPDTVHKAMWVKNWIRTLTLKEAKSKAFENASRQTVVLDDTASLNEVSSFIFPLTCPISQQLLETPVRGEHCTHWQCFDLRNFVAYNAHVTGTRWECPVCTKILSLHDLQYCPLTASILNQYKKEAAPHRDRVQFFANGTWKLLDEAKKRYSKKRPADSDTVNGNKRMRSNGETTTRKGSPEVIDLL